MNPKGLTNHGQSLTDARKIPKASQALLEISNDHNEGTLYDVSITTLARRHNTNII